MLMVYINGSGSTLFFYQLPRAHYGLVATIVFLLPMRPRLWRTLDEHTGIPPSHRAPPRHRTAPHRTAATNMLLMTADQVTPDHFTGTIHSAENPTIFRRPEEYVSHLLKARDAQQSAFSLLRCKNVLAYINVDLLVAWLLHTVVYTKAHRWFECRGEQSGHFTCILQCVICRPRNRAFLAHFTVVSHFRACLGKAVEGSIVPLTLSLCVLM